MNCLIFYSDLREFFINTGGSQLSGPWLPWICNTGLNKIFHLSMPSIVVNRLSSGLANKTLASKKIPIQLVLLRKSIKKTPSHYEKINVRKGSWTFSKIVIHLFIFKISRKIFWMSSALKCAVKVTFKSKCESKHQWEASDALANFFVLQSTSESVCSTNVIWILIIGAFWWGKNRQ